MWGETHPGDSNTLQHGISAAVLNPETSNLIQTRHPYTGNLNKETSGDGENASLRCADVVG